MSYQIDWKDIWALASVISQFSFLSSSLDSWVQKLDKDDFKYLSHKFDKNLLNLVKQKKNVKHCLAKEELSSKEEFYSLLKS